MSKKTNYTAQEVIATCLTYMNSEHVKFVNKAYLFAESAHSEQMRKSGEMYIVHPIQVAVILAEINMDPVTVAAGFLHDVVEDTDITFEDLEKQGFSDEIINALKLLTHDKSLPYMDYIAEIKKKNIATKVKLADLRHNSDLTRLDVIDEKALKRKEKYEKAIKLLEE